MLAFFPDRYIGKWAWADDRITILERNHTSGSAVHIQLLADRPLVYTVASLVRYVSDMHLYCVGATIGDKVTSMRDVLRFLGGLCGAALQWITGLICMIPVLLLSLLGVFGSNPR